MPDNPLLPQHRLRELHAMMLHVRKLEQRQPHPVAREALLASMRLHLLAGDLLSGPPGDRTLRELAPTSASAASRPSATPQPDLPSRLRLPLCAGAARGMQSVAAPKGLAANLTVAYAEAGAHEPGWPDALIWAHRNRLPLLLVCHDATLDQASRRPSRATHTPISWPAVSPLARKLHLPLFPVDGGDAVAVFRVMQEATARARDHGGPSILWAVQSAARLPRRQQPLGRLEAYLATRGISLKE